jgi:hypothetical protein
MSLEDFILLASAKAFQATQLALIKLDLSHTLSKYLNVTSPG